MTVRVSQGCSLAVYEEPDLKLNQKYVQKDQLYGSYQKLSDVEFGFNQFLKN